MGKRQYKLQSGDYGQAIYPTINKDLKFKTKNSTVKRYDPAPDSYNT